MYDLKVTKNEDNTILQNISSYSAHFFVVNVEPVDIFDLPVGNKGYLNTIWTPYHESFEIYDWNKINPLIIGERCGLDSLHYCSKKKKTDEIWQNNFGFFNYPHSGKVHPAEDWNKFGWKNDSGYFSFDNGENIYAVADGIVVLKTVVGQVGSYSTLYVRKQN